MVDFISIVAYVKIYPENLFEPIEWRDLIFTPVYRKTKSTAVDYYEGEYEGLRVLLHPDRIQITNSLHKFYKLNNYSDFSLSELGKAIDKLCDFTGIKAEHWEIKKMEFGFNLITPQPAHNYVDLAILYKEREFVRMAHRQKHYGQKCYFSEYAIKFYDKSAQVKLKDRVAVQNDLFRVEVCYLQKRKLPNGIKTLEDLKDKEKIKLLYDELKKIIETIVYNDIIDLTASNFEERVLFYASLNPDFLKVEQKINKDQVQEIKKSIKQLRERFLEKTFKKWLINALSDKYIDLFCS